MRGFYVCLLRVVRRGYREATHTDGEHGVRVYVKHGWYEVKGSCAYLHAHVQALLHYIQTTYAPHARM